MSDEPNNLVLELLRGLRADLTTVKNDTSMLRRQMTSIGLDLARLRQDAAGDAVQRSHAAERVDTLEDRLARVEAKLGIGDP